MITRSASRLFGSSALPIAFVSVLLIASTIARPADADDSSPIDLAQYARLLERHTQAVPDIVGTRVDYAALARSSEWKSLVAQVRAARPGRLDRNGQIAFWINAYNILTIDLILQHYPVESIRDIGSFFSPVWNIEVATIEGRSLSLGQIEHEILRKMAEPRIHAAIVCASTSCPPLARHPFRSTQLDDDLAAAMRRWLASPEKGVFIDRERSIVRVSKIFDWFEADFEAGGGVLKTITPYLDPGDAEWLRANGPRAKIRYLDYDWSLNALR